MADRIEKLTGYAAQFPVDEIPEAVIDYTQYLLQDTIACILSGSSAAGVRELLDAQNIWSGNEQARIISFSKMTSAPSAAFLNAVMCHANDFDDTHDGAVNHGCVTIVPALLALCEVLNKGEIVASGIQRKEGLVSGREFLAALAVGLDVSNRLGMAFIPYLHVGWLPTTLWGPFGTAAACGRLLGLDKAQMRNAFGLAYSQMHGNRQGLADGALSKRIQPAFSAVAGLQAALFASQGITGARHIIDGAFGIRELYTNGKLDAEFLNKGLGVRFETTKISVKPYPCCRCSHPVIDAALELKSEHGIDWWNITSGSINLPPQSMGQIGNQFAIRENPTVDAQFSAQYTAALAFINGWPRVEDFEVEAIRENKDVQTLAKKFTPSAFSPESAGILPVEMEIRMSDGREFSTRIETAKGSPERPLTEEEVEMKFGMCVGNGIRKFSAEEKEALLGNLKKVKELEDISQLIDRL